MAGDPRSARIKALAGIMHAQEKAKIDAISAQLLGAAAANKAALEGRATVLDADRAAAEAAAAAESGGEAPPDITQFFPSTPVNPNAAPQGMISAQPAIDLAGGAGGARGGALANRAVAGARQAAGTLPIAQREAAPQGAGGGMSVNVGGQRFSAPDTITRTQSTTAPLEYSPGFFAPATTTTVSTEPNVLSAGDILAAQQRNQAMTNETLFRLGQEGVLGPDAVTAAEALNRGDYDTYGRVLAKNPLLSAQVQRKQMEVQDAHIESYRAASAEAYERTRGNRVVNDMLVAQFRSFAEGQDDLSDNDIFGIPYPEDLGGIGSFPKTAAGALGALGGGGKGAITHSVILDKLRSIKVDKNGELDAGSKSALLYLQGWGIKNGVAVVAVPKRGTVTDLMRSFGMGGSEVSHVQMVPMAEVLGTALQANAGDETQIGRITTEWSLFDSSGRPTSGPNAALAAGIRRKLQLIDQSRAMGGDPAFPQVNVPAVEGPSPDALDAELEAEVGRPPIGTAKSPGEFVSRVAGAVGRAGQNVVLGREEAKQFRKRRAEERPRFAPAAPPKPYGP